MSECFIGEIRMFAGNYAPENWSVCDGSLLSINQNQALFTLIGKVYGGDGVNDFALPDLRGRIPVGMGQGTGLTARPIGQSAGVETVPLAQAELPSHTHALSASTGLANNVSPGGNVLAQTSTSPKNFAMYTVAQPTPAPTPVTLASGVVSSVGGGQPHANMMPSLGITFIIALTGNYPLQH